MKHDARNARRGRALAVVIALAGVSGLAAGCEALRGKPDEAPAEAKAPAEAEETTPAPEPPEAPPSLLAGVIERAIVPPPEGGSTYRVDAYLGALIVEQLRVNPLPFTAWRSETQDPARPSAGYRVGPLAADDPWSRLGLKEGDIITELNGVPSTDEGWVAQALSRGENQVTVGVFRDGVSIVLSYRMMGAMAWNAVRQELVPPSEMLLAEAPEDDDPGETAGDLGLGGDDEAGSDPGGSVGVGTRPSSGSRPSSGAGTGSGARPRGGSSSGSGSSRPSTGGAAPVAQCSSDSRCTIKKSYLDGVLASPAKLEREATIVPAIRNDVHSGYKLKTVRPGSAVAQLGFRAGDKITHINGRDLTNDIEAMQLYMGLSSTRRFNVRYVRGSSTRTKTIDVV